MTFGTVTRGDRILVQVAPLCEGPEYHGSGRQGHLGEIPLQIKYPKKGGEARKCGMVKKKCECVGKKMKM